MATMHNEQQYIIDFYKKGANGYYIKGCATEVLVEAINTVYKEGYHITKACSEAILKETVKDVTSEAEKKIHFNTQQLKIIILTAAGKSNKEIADQLCITIKTVDYHKHNIYEKTKTTNSAGLTDYAHRNGIMK